MANTYQRITIGLGGGTDDRRVKVSSDDIQAGFLEEKIVPATQKVVVTVSTPGGAELFEIDLDEAFIDHDLLLNYDLNEHRPLDDGSTTTTSLWSSDKIQTELDTKINAATPMTDNKLVKSVGTSGVDVEATGIDVDDLDNVTGINNLTIDGDLTVNGTTTSVNSSTLDVTDANITVNNGGTQASADAGNAGLTVEMSDATDVELGYDSTTASKMALGEVGSLSEVITASHTQTLLNKTLDADNNTLSNIETDNLKSGVLATDLDVAVDNTNIAGAQAIKDYVVARVAEKDAADEISFNPIASGLTAINVQDAIDEVEDRLDTAESTLSTHIGAGTGKHAATQITYDGTTSGLVATAVQAAIDELDGIVDGKLDTADFGTEFDSALALKDTADLSEGTNLYHTDERSQDAVGTILTDTNSINFTYDDGTPQITADLTISPLSSPAAIDPDADLLVMQDISAGTIHKILISDVSSIGSSTGDLAEGSFSAANNQITPADVTGLNFPIATVRAFDALVSVEIDATLDQYEEITLKGINKGSDFDYSISSIGDDSGIGLSMSAGQVQYTSTNQAGYASSEIKFRASTLSVTSVFGPIEVYNNPFSVVVNGVEEIKLHTSTSGTASFNYDTDHYLIYVSGPGADISPKMKFQNSTNIFSKLLDLSADIVVEVDYNVTADGIDAGDTAQFSMTAINAAETQTVDSSTILDVSGVANGIGVQTQSFTITAAQLGTISDLGFIELNGFVTVTDGGGNQIEINAIRITQ